MATILEMIQHQYKPTEEELREYNEYFDTAERSNKHPLPFEAWKLFRKD